VSDCLVELDALAALFSDDPDGLNSNPHVLMFLERVE